MRYDRDPSGTASTTGRTARVRARLLAVLLVLLLLGLAALVWVSLTRSVPLLESGEADEVQERREQVMSTSEQFLLRMGTYGPDMLDDQGKMPKYRERVQEVITDKFAESFKEQAQVAEQLVARADQAREAEVFASGVASVDDDAATTLVAGSFTDTYGKGEPQAPSSFRMEVELVRVDGEWLVDSFSPVTDEGQGSERGSGQGSGGNGHSPAPTPGGGSGGSGSSGEGQP